jgi:outer membrane protein
MKRPRITAALECAVLTTSLAVGAAVAQQPGHNDTLRLDLHNSVEIAIQNATPVQIGTDTVRLSGIALLESYGRFLPNVTTTFGGFDQRGLTLLSATSLAPADAQFYGLGYQVSASINLFNGFRDREHLRATLNSRDAATSSLDRARQQVAFDVAQAYYQLVLDRRLASVASANVALSRAREDQLAEQVRIGTKAPPDLYRQQAQARADEVAVIDANNRVQNDGVALLSRLRVDATRPYAIVEPAADTTRLPNDSLELNDLLQRAYRERADLAAARQRASADTHEMQAAHGEYLPQVALRFDYAGSSRVFGRELIDGQNQLTVDQRSLGSQLGDQRYGVLSLAASWNLFDGYRARFDIERAAVATDRDRLNIEDLQLRIGGELQTAIGNYRAADQKLVATAAAIDAAQQAFDAVQGRYDVGLASVVDVLTAQTSLTQARALREQAVANMALQKAVLRYAVGDAPIPLR